MNRARIRETICNKAVLALLILLVTVHLSTQLRDSYRFTVALRSLLRAVAHTQAYPFALCADWEAEAASHLRTTQRLVVGSVLRSVGCWEQAARILPAFTPAWDRSALLAYQWGLIAWQRGDMVGAAEMWRQGRDIDRRLLYEAQWMPISNLEEAQRRYEAAIMAAGSLQMQAETITAYTEGLRGRMPAGAFRARLAYLEAYFGTDTAIGRRLAGQRAWGDGSYEEAFDHLWRAITAGFADAETWYLLGEAAWKTGDLVAVEKAFHAALDAPIQVTGRRPWHLDRLAALLSSQGRLDEALLFQEEAVRLNDYYFYADNLAVLYAQLGQMARAQAMCARAAASGSAPKVLRCQNP